MIQMIFDSPCDGRSNDLTQISTDEIMNQIKEAPGQFSEKKLDHIESIRFESYLNRLMEKYHCSAGKLIIRTCLSKLFVYQI